MSADCTCGLINLDKWTVQFGATALQSYLCSVLYLHAASAAFTLHGNLEVHLLLGGLLVCHDAQLCCPTKQPVKKPQFDGKARQCS